MLKAVDIVVVIVGGGGGGGGDVSEREFVRPRIALYFDCVLLLLFDIFYVLYKYDIK